MKGQFIQNTKTMCLQLSLVVSGHADSFNNLLQISTAASLFRNCVAAALDNP